MAKPFLKWAGSKYKLIRKIKPLLPPAKRLIEPFVGSGALFLNTDYPAYLLTDSNADLIRLYQYVQREGLSFIDYCEALFIDKNLKTHFYEVRDLFNLTTDLRFKAALFIYLNRHCFNGLCRYNLQGKYNVPFGSYKRPYFPRQEMLNFHVKSQQAIFEKKDFLTTMKSAKPGDVLYCDPPYVPLSLTANFTNYTAHRFGLEQQIALAEQAEKLAEQGIIVLISNHRTPFVRKLYSQAKLKHFRVHRSISCQGTSRKKVAEIIAIFA